MPNACTPLAIADLQRRVAGQTARQLARQRRALEERCQRGPFYYIMSLYHSRGEVLTWWKPNNAGYTTSLAQAGRYSKAEIDGDCHYYNSVRNKPVRCEVADKMAYLVVDAGKMAELARKAPRRPARRNRMALYAAMHPKAVP